MAKPSTIHDVRYLVAGLRVLARYSEPAVRGLVEGEIRSEIEKYVNERNLTFGLPQHNYEYKEVPSLVLRDLSVFGFVGFEKEKVALSAPGRDATAALVEGRIQNLYDLLASRHLDVFSEVNQFIVILSKRSGRSAKVANPNSSRLSYFVGTKGRPFSLDETIQGLSSEVSKLDMSSDFETELTQTLRSISNALRSFDGKVLLPEQRNKIFRTIENEIERYCVRYYFSPVIMTRARYDIVRDRLSDLGLVNVILRKGSWITEEEIYSVAVPSHSYHDGVFPTHDTKELGEVFRVRVHWPSYENQKEEFVKSLIDAAKLADTGIGFADIPTVREIVSERLMIPSSLFDSFLRKASNEADIKIDFALASERVTSSRLPILLSASKAYNLIRVRT